MMVSSIDFEALRSCGGIKIFSELAMTLEMSPAKKKEEMLAIIFNTLAFILIADKTERCWISFYEVEGMIEFVISTFEKEFSFVFDDEYVRDYFRELHRTKRSKEESPKMPPLKDRSFFLLELISIIFYSNFSRVQELFFEAEISKYLMEIIEFSDFIQDWSSNSNEITWIKHSVQLLKLILIKSKRERIRVHRWNALKVLNKLAKMTTVFPPEFLTDIHTCIACLVRRHDSFSHVNFIFHLTYGIGFNG